MLKNLLESASPRVLQHFNTVRSRYKAELTINPGGHICGFSTPGTYVLEEPIETNKKGWTDKLLSKRVR